MISERVWQNWIFSISILYIPKTGHTSSPFCRPLLYTKQSTLLQCLTKRHHDVWGHDSTATSFLDEVVLALASKEGKGYKISVDTRKFKRYNDIIYIYVYTYINIYVYAWFAVALIDNVAVGLGWGVGVGGVGFWVGLGVAVTFQEAAFWAIASLGWAGYRLVLWLLAVFRVVLLRWC